MKFSLQAASSGALIIVEESSSYGNLQLLMVVFLSSLFFIIFQRYSVKETHSLKESYKGQYILNCRTSCQKMNFILTITFKLATQLREHFRNYRRADTVRPQV